MINFYIKIFFYILEILFSLFFLIHLYWGFGGKRLIDYALPRNESGKLYFHPRKISTLAVSLASLMVFLFLCYFESIQKEFYSSWFMFLFLGICFLARGIGDFKTVGLFKRKIVNHFYKADNRFYTPLCFVLSILCFVIFIYGITQTKS